MLLQIIPWLVVGAGCWVAFQFVRQMGRVLVRLDAIEQEMTVARIGAANRTEDPVGAHETAAASSVLANSKINRSGLPAETQAPPFSIPLLAGDGVVSLEHYRGRTILLVLVTTECPPCDELFSKLCTLPPEAAAKSLVIVARGDRSQLLEKALRCNPAFSVGVQDGWEVSRQYGIFKFPTGYIIGGDGTTIGEVVLGPDDLLRVAQLIVLAADQPGPSHIG